MKIKVKKNVIKFILSLLVFFGVKNYGQEAFVAKPVIDLTGSPLKTDSTPAAEQYKQFALVGSEKPAYHCPRLQQLLLHEPIQIIEEINDEEVRVRIPQLFWIHKVTKQKMNELYTLKENLITAHELKSQASLIKSDLTCILTQPYADPILKTTYSAATTFVITFTMSHHYIVNVLDPRDRTVKETIIPKHLCKVHDPTEPFQDRKKKLINLARQWASGKDGIAYVWGGSSYQYRYPFASVLKEHDGIRWYETKKPQNQYAGYDCSSLIYRLAQISNIHFPYKNTTTMRYYLPTLKRNEKLEEGDIFIYPGHVMLVSDLKKNTLIDARGHDIGYSRVHEIALSDYFREIKNFDELINASHEQQPLTLLDSKGEPTETIENYTFLKLVEPEK